MLAYVLGWIAFLPLVLSNTGLGVVPINVPFEFSMLGVSTPTLAALWTHWLIHRNFRICRFATSWRRLLAGCLVGAVVVMFAFVILPSILLVKGSPRAIHWTALSAAWVYWSNPLNLLGGPLNEEPGWRGFALPRLQQRFGPLMGSTLLGLLWAGWHVPLFFVQEWLGIPWWAFIMLILCQSIFMTWGTNLSEGNIIVPMLMHATFNSSFPLLFALCQDLPTRGRFLPYYLSAAAAVAIATILLTRGRLGIPKLIAVRHSA